jgi:uroporphyrinogen III methyltransferase/synthase
MTVHLVGAGCGGPLWLTLRGRELIEQAGHIVHDSLIHPDLLQLASPECAFHPVGKRKGRPSPKQEEINGLLVELGATGKNVVRLKGGDPFVFGRGGEEALALEKAGIPWTFTPGITAALGGLGCAGIPPTHRGCADSVTLVTGHCADGEEPDEEFWRTLGSLRGTKAVYMGASSMKKLLPLLLEGGLPPETRCAAVTWGGWGRAFATSFFPAEPPDIPSPSILAIGGTADLRLLPERGPLSGLQVGLVRPAPESWSTARALECLGADAYSLPVLKLEEIRAPGEEEKIATADWLVLTSPRGASLLLDRVDPRRISGRIAAIGEGTASALAVFGIRADAVASPSTSEALAALLTERVRPAERVVFFRNEAGSPLPEKAVLARGATLENISAYRMVPALPPGWDSYETLWDECGLDALVFGSAALAAAWSEYAPPPGAAVRLVAWGETCGKTVERLFGQKPLVMKSADFQGLVSALAEVRRKDS